MKDFTIKYGRWFLKCKSKEKSCLKIGRWILLVKED